MVSPFHPPMYPSKLVRSRFPFFPPFTLFTTSGPSHPYRMFHVNPRSPFSSKLSITPGHAPCSSKFPVSYCFPGLWLVCSSCTPPTLFPVGSLKMYPCLMYLPWTSPIGCRLYPPLGGGPYLGCRTRCIRAFGRFSLLLPLLPHITP